MKESETLIESLRDPGVYPHSVDRLDVIETHISWVILTGPFAYKFKKPVQYDFVDFSELEDRKRFCERELELNRRLAPDLYDSVVSVTGTPSNPSFDGEGEPLEYAVKMIEFPQSNLLSERIENEGLSSDIVNQLADVVSDFHQSIDSNPPSEDYASPGLIEDNMEETFTEIEASDLSGEHRRVLERIEKWSRNQFRDLKPLMTTRRANGSVKNCHGDMHLRNIVLFNDELTVFDCIEFNDSFRWIDVIDEIAFLTMDLIERGHGEEANRFLDRYLTATDQYEGLRLLTFYQVYRAMVRCKVTYLQARQAEGAVDLPREFYDYLECARSFTDRPGPLLVITHGVSGTGKTTVTQKLLESIGAIRLRSDVERKRIAGVSFTSDAGADPNEDLYSEEMTQRTYDRLKTKAETVLQAGFPAIVDATFLKRNFRKDFQQLADRLEVPFRILHITCDEGELRRRLGERQKQEDTVSDAGETILDYQFEVRDELEPVEKKKSIEVQSDGAGLTREAIDRIRTLAD